LNIIKNKNKKTNKKDLGGIPNVDSSHTYSPRGHFMSFCWGSISKANHLILPGIGLYSFATGRGYTRGPIFLQYSNNNESLPSLGKLKVWGQKHYCEPQLMMLLI